MGNTRGLTDKPIVREVIEEDGRVVAAHLSDVVTDPNSADAVQVPDPDQYPSANATAQNPLAVHQASSPADALDPDEGAGTNEVQTLNFTGTVSGGTWGFQLPSETGADDIPATQLAYNASLATVQAAIDAALGNRATDGEGNRNVVAAGGPAPTDITLTFQNDFGYQDLSATVPHAGSLTGGGSLQVDETTKGVHSDAP